MVRSSEDELPRATLNTVFAPGIELRSEGRVVSGREAVATEWRRLFAHDGRTAYFAYSRVAAPRSDRGELHGFFKWAGGPSVSIIAAAIASTVTDPS